MSLHTYSVNDLLNSTERTQVLYKLAAGASVIAGGAGWLFAWITQHWSASVVLTAPAAVVVYLFSVRLVELYLWKESRTRLLLGITLPNINGRWNAKVDTRTRDGKDLISGNEGTLYVFQTWSTLGVELETKRTHSYSTGAFLTQGAHYLILTLEYQVDLRDPHQENDDIQAHKGTSKLRIPMFKGKCDLSHIEAPYYTDHRETGMIQLEHIRD